MTRQETQVSVFYDASNNQSSCKQLKFLSELCFLSNIDVKVPYFVISFFFFFFQYHIVSYFTTSAINILMNAKNVESVLYLKMQDEQVECPLCEQKLILKNIGNFPFLCCPNFDNDRCKVKMGVSKFTGPCRGCFQQQHKIIADELTWFWEFTPFHEECAHDRIFEILIAWGKSFEIDFSPNIGKQTPICSACSTQIPFGPHIAQKRFGLPKQYFHFDTNCSGWAASVYNPVQEGKREKVRVLRRVKSYQCINCHQGCMHVLVISISL